MIIDPKIYRDKKGAYRYALLEESDQVLEGDETLLSSGKWAAERRSSGYKYEKTHNPKRRKKYLTIEERIQILEEKMWWLHEEDPPLPEYSYVNEYEKLIKIEDDIIEIVKKEFLQKSKEKKVRIKDDH